MIILHHREVMMNEHLLQHLEKLPYFLAIASQRSFHGAARTLRISQSALSRSMKQLENDIGVKLFQRQPRGVCLTPEGEILSQFARLITSQARKVESQILKQNEEIESILRLGAYGTIANQFGPTLLQETYVRHPKTIVHLTIESSGQTLAKALQNKSLDAAIFVTDSSFPRLNYQVLLTEYYQTYLTSDSRLVPAEFRHKKKFDFSDFSKLPLFIYKQAIGGHVESLDRLLNDSKLLTHKAFQVNDFQTVRNYVGSGLGFGVLPRLCGDEFVIDGLLKPAYFKTLPSNGFGHHEHKIFWRSDDPNSERLADLVIELYPKQKALRLTV